MKINGFAENRALMQILTQSEHSRRPPSEIVASALAGGVVVVFTDELMRFGTRVLLPSPRDLQMLAMLIADGFFAPMLPRAIGDHLRQPTIVAEFGCFELLALVVLLFPDCFADAPASDRLNGSDVSTESMSTQLPSSGTVPGDVLLLHGFRMDVGLMLLSSVNEVLYGAEVWRLRAGQQETSPALTAARALLAQYYELKLLLVSCVESARQAYDAAAAPVAARVILAGLFSPAEQRRLFELRSRPAEAAAAAWFDAALAPLAGAPLAAPPRPAGLRSPRLLLHRSPGGAGATALRLPPRAAADTALPRLPLQQGELALLLPGAAPLYDAAPSLISALLRRAAGAKLTPAQQRDAEKTLAAHAWRSVSPVVAECVRRLAASDAAVLALLEKNSGFAARLVRWLHEDTEDGSALAKEIVDHVVRAADVGTPAALFIREVGSAGGLSEVQFCAWVARSLPDLATKTPAAVGQFAAVVAFTLVANHSWELTQEARDGAMHLCASHKQQSDCALLLSILRRGKSD